jgi:hypothetical protein
MPVSAAPLSQPIQRYAVNKYAQNRRSLGAVPKSASPTQAVNISPNIQPTPISRISSPTVSALHRSPNFLPQNGPMSPSFGPTSGQVRPQQPLRPQFNPPPPPPPRPSLATTGYPPSASTINSAASAPSSAGANPNQAPNPNNFYNTPFQSHYDQLGKYNKLRGANYVRKPSQHRNTEQEYDQTDDMYDDEDPDEQHHSAGASAYSNNAATFTIPGTHNMQQQHPSGNQQPQHMPTNGVHHQQPLQPQASQHTDTSPTFGSSMNTQMTAGYDSYDPMLDADPFGLTASMHFPTQFTFDAGVSR